jgi:hypothetical protein
MLPHLLVNRAFDVENEKTSEKRATAKSWCGNWVIWRANRMGELRRKERSQLACTVALESPLECLPKGGAEDSGASLLGRRYPVRPSRTYAGIASGATRHRRTYLASGSILFARLTPASATQLVECTAADFAIGATI